MNIGEANDTQTVLRFLRDLTDGKGSVLDPATPAGAARVHSAAEAVGRLAERSSRALAAGEKVSTAAWQVRLQLLSARSH